MRPPRTALAVLALAVTTTLTGCSSGRQAGSAEPTATPVPSVSFEVQTPDAHRSTAPIRNRNYPFLIQAVPGLPDGTIVVRTRTGAALGSLVARARRLPGVTSVDTAGSELRLKTNGPTFQTLTDDVATMEKADGVQQVVVVVAYADPSLSPMP